MTDTPALDYLSSTGVDFEVVRTARAGSVEEAAALRGLPVAAVLKSIVVRLREGDYIFVLAPGDRAIDWGMLRRHLGVRRLSLPDAAEARDATGYERGAITPFGSKNAWPVVADARIADVDAVSIGGGAHGVSVTIGSGALRELLGAALVPVTRSCAAS